MRILYFGTVCDLKAYDQRFAGYASKPSVAPVVFETALLEGFHQNAAEIQIHSFPMIPTYPGYRKLRFGGMTEALSCGYTCRWLNTVNLPLLKQLSRRLDARRVMKKWLKENAGNGLILTYSIPPFLVRDVLTCARRYHVKTAAIIPDLLRDMYINENKHTVSYRLKQLYLAQPLRLQGGYDGYIYLTEAMREVVAPSKPYLVMEGIADTAKVLPPEEKSKAAPKGIMYAGMLHEKYGILNLVEAFEKLNMPDTELWLFGEGTAVAEIKRRAVANPQIRYFGALPRAEILEYERKATLLVNPRSPDEEFTKYSFPSKTIEYMLSGTPLLTTKLKGIPSGYFDYLFSSESNSPDALAEAMEKALEHTGKALMEMGIRAQDYVRREKNAGRQAKRILTFLEGLYYDTEDRG